MRRGSYLSADASMVTVKELTDPYAASLRPVPPSGIGVCDVCHSGPRTGFTRCRSCSDSTGRVSHPVTRVVPISLMTTSSDDQLYHLLRSYKRFSTNSMLIARVAALIGRHLSTHGRCLAGDEGWDLVTTVPSTKGKTDHPLVRAVRRLAGLKDNYAELLIPHTGPFDRTARDDMFAATQDLTGQRVLLIDDTFTSGAHVQSAASALSLAGARIAGTLVVGRLIDPGYNGACERIWEWSTHRSYDFDVCARCT